MSIVVLKLPDVKRIAEIVRIIVRAAKEKSCSAGEAGSEKSGTIR
jgi:hypothetical protein